VGEALGSASVTNNQGHALTVGTNFGVQFDLYDPSLSFVETTTPMQTFSDHLNTTTATSASHPTIDVSNSNFADLGLDGSLIGIGTATWDTLAYDATFFTPVDITNAHSISGKYQLVIDYYYTGQPVPEPGSLALLGLGLPMMGMWFRRKRTSK
jgi:hypothetical protein